MNFNKIQKSKRLISLTFLSIALNSCLFSSTEGDPQIVEEYDFTKAWNESVAEKGRLLDSTIFSVGKFHTLVYATESSGGERGVATNYKYDTIEVSENDSAFIVNGVICLKNGIQSPIIQSTGACDFIMPKNMRLFKCIVNSNTDTIGFRSEQSGSGILQNFSYKQGLPAIYVRMETPTGSAHKYLHSIDGIKFDLISDVKSTYNTLKYLGKDRSDSLNPF